MLKSIRWSLLVWHGFILLMVLAGFGTMLFYRIRHSRYQAVDAELAGTAHMLVGELHPRHRPPRDRPGAPPERRDPFFNELDAEISDPAMSEPRLAPEDDPQPTRDFDMRFAVESRGNAYYAAWRSDGTRLAASRAGAGVAYPGKLPVPPPPTSFRWRDGFREAIAPGPANTTVLVGRSVAREQAELRQLAITLGGTGAGLLAMGLLGGWLVATRAIRPIHAIGEAAEKISGSNLSRRIDVAETNSELGTLAQVLNAMFARLETAFDRQVRFTADASHELRTPLSIIYSNTELALSKERSVEEYRETLHSTFRAAKRMKSLVEGLLVLAGADAGKLAVNRQPLDLAPIVRDCAELVAPLAADRQVKVELNVDSDQVSGDAMRLSQLMMNLLSNAILYNRPDGRVSVTLSTHEPWVLLQVTDTGAGVAPEHLPHLFDRFYRADASRSRESGGTGLGLAICKSIVEAHEGEISVVSEAGVGSTFSVRLPSMSNPSL
jgi:heavy metal sensor kinase